MLFDQFSQPESLVEFAHPDKTSVGSDVGTLEIDLERAVELVLKGLILSLTHWLLTSYASSDQHEY